MIPKRLTAARMARSYRRRVGSVKAGWLTGSRVSTYSRGRSNGSRTGRDRAGQSWNVGVGWKEAMPNSDTIPAPAVRRLSLYLRQLEEFLAGGRATVSSRDLGAALALSAAQVRKDLAYFGQFGHSGIGYSVTELIDRVRRIMGTDRQTNVLLVGVGNLGRALISFRGFGKHGFEVVAAFDNDPSKIGERIPVSDGILIQPLSELAREVKKQRIRMAILTVPAPVAQATAEELTAAGIRAILNFAPVTLQLNSDVAVSSVDLGVHLEQLAFQVSTGT